MWRQVLGQALSFWPPYSSETPPLPRTLSCWSWAVQGPATSALSNMGTN